MKALVTTVPFGQVDEKPFELLKSVQIEYSMNPLGRKLTESELAILVNDVDILIAGTEPITKYVLKKAPKLKLIARVGIGLDSVDLIEARRRGISVAYTPDAPSAAVADLTIGLMFSLLRNVHESNLGMRENKWRRFLGRRLNNVTIGVIGVGRIGKIVLDNLVQLHCKKILIDDIDILAAEKSSQMSPVIEVCDKDKMFRNADVITIHVPLTSQTRDMVNTKQLMMMQTDAVIVNTSRGGVVNEQALYEVMVDGHLAGAALDVFEEEPYCGPLMSIKRCVLTAHMGSMSTDCRALMEIQATEDAVRFVNRKPLLFPVPQGEYLLQIDKQSRNSR